MNESRASWTTTLVVGVISLLPRLYAALAFSREPVWDGHYYDYGARRIAQGLGYSDDLMMGAATLWRPWCHYPVGYSGFLAFLYSIFGNGQFIAPVANALLGAWAVMITHRIGIHWLSPRRAIVAALLCGTSLELILYSPVVMTEVLAMTLPMTAIWIAVVWGKRLSAAVATGAVLGFGTLVQPQTILLAPLLGAVMGGWSLGIRKILWMSFLTTAVALCVVSPWTIRNCRVMDGCAWVSTNGGWNLAIGAFPRATGRFETLKASDGCAVVTGQVQQDRCWASLGMSWIKQDFSRWLRLAPLKLGHCFDHASFAVEYLGQADPQLWSEPVRQRWRDWLTTAHRLLLSVAAFGFVAFRVRDAKGFVVETGLRMIVAGFVAYAWSEDQPSFWPLAICIVATGLIPRKSAPALGTAGMALTISFLLFVVTHVIFFGEDRYHVRLIPMMCLLAAACFRPSRNVDEDSLSRSPTAEAKA